MMEDFEIRVTKAPKRKTENPVSRFLRNAEAKVKKAFMRPGLVAAAAVTCFVVLVGTPHVGWEYQCRHGMSGPNTCRSYAWCGYYGIQGRRVVVPPEGQHCRVLTMLTPDWSRLIGRG